jgi:hypothetical protein
MTITQIHVTFVLFCTVLCVFAQELEMPTLNCSVAASNVSALLAQYNITLTNRTNRTALSTILPISWNCTGLVTAQTCPAGLYSTLGSAACTIPCPANYFCAGNGTATVCPPGTFSTGGADSAAGCTQCPAGSFCKNGIKAFCPAGYLSLAGASSCPIPCPPGFFCPRVGFAVECPTLGTYALSNATYNCTECEPGYQCPTTTSRLFCPPNTWSLPGSTNCTLPCPEGVICPGNGKMSCTVCAPGVFTVRPCSGKGDTICNTTCPPGMFGAFYTRGFCQDCEKGMYNDKYGMTTCDTCPSGKYANTTGNPECLNCPPGSNTNVFTGFITCQKVRKSHCPYGLKCYLSSAFSFEYVT